MGIALVDPRGRLLVTNPALQRMLGYSSDELTQLDTTGITHPDDAGAEQVLYRNLVAGQADSYTLHKRLLRADGSTLRAIVTLARVPSHDGAPGCAVVTVQDVTESQSLRENLRLLQREFGSLLRHGREVFGVLGRDGRLRSLTPSVLHVLGYRRSQLAATNPRALVHPDDAPAATALFRLALRTPGRPVTGEVRVRHRSGSYRAMEVVLTNRFQDRTVRGIVLRSSDVTGRREAEEALRRSEQQLLEVQKMEAVGRLAGGVAHDFNNLLTAIRGNAEMLLLDLPAESELREEVEEIRRAVERATALTRQLLAFSRRQILQPRLLDLNNSVREMERMLRRLLGEDVDLQTQLDPELRRVRADPTQVAQVILNLAVNARDAMPEGGVLVLSTSNAELTQERVERYPYVVPGEYVLLQVLDTGQGMEPRTVQMAFEPFFTTKPGGRGTGLGLSMVYGIVKQSGGYVWIDSEPGRGTSVQVYLPMASGVEPEEVIPAPAPHTQGRGTVLVVEDEEPVRRIAERVLSRGGYTVLTAAEGAEAMALSRQYPGIIHVLVTDLVMPRMSGSDLARRLMAERPGIRVLFISGYERDTARTERPQEPGTDFVAKPFSPEALLEHVGRLLRHRTGR